MTMIGDRFTRSMTARFVWGGLVVLSLIGLFVARSQQTTALNTEIQDAQGRAAHVANTTVADAAIVDTRAGTITFDKKGFEIAMEGDVLTDPTVARLRVWDADGLLLASTDPSEAVSQLVASDPHVTNALDGTTSAQVALDEPFTYSTVGSPKQPTDLLDVFTPFRVKDQVQPVGAVQVDFQYGDLQAAAASPWETVSRAFLILAVLSGVLFLVSLARRPVKTERAVALPVPIAGAPEPASTPAPVPDERSEALEEELQIAHEQLEQASEAFAFLEAKLKDGSGAPVSSVDVEAAMSRIAELEAALQRAEDDAATARTNAVTQDDLEQVRRQADERVAELERQMHEDASKPDPELEALRARLADAEARAEGAEAALQSARADVQAARREVDAVPVDEVPNSLIEELEAKVAEAEARAKEAEDEALRITPEANDLRAKLAQAAARKKLGSS
jgi:hypothetical protein